jgi:PST family polysaccharide transporter
MVTSWISYLPAAIRSRLQDRPYAQQIAGNSVWLFADKVVRAGVGLFVGVWMARYLGPAQFGQLSYAIAFVALFTPIASLGLEGITVRELVRHPEKKNEILGSVFTLKLIGGIVAFLGVLAVLSLMRHEEVQVRWLVTIVALGMIFQAVDVADLWFQSQVQSRYTVIAKNVAFLSLAGIKVWLIVTRADVVAFAWAATAEIALGAVGFYIAFRSVGNTWGTLRPAMVRMTSLLKESWPLLLSGLAIMLYMRIDQVMLAKMVGEQAVGLYSAALRFSEAWYVIPAIVVSSVMPALTEARAKSQEQYYQRLQRMFVLLVRIAYLVAIPMTVLSSPLIHFFYGESYGPTGLILAVHIWTAVFVFLGVASGPWIVNEGLTKLSLYQTILGATSNIALNLYLIPLYGAVGAAFATVISQGLSAWLSNFFLARGRQLFWLQSNAIAMGLYEFRPR